MRRLALAAAAALAACSVKLEGAPCATDANCPDDQRCEGAGAQPGRCVACQSDPACAADGFACAGGATVRECRTNAGSCHYARYIACGTLTCLAGSCTCPSNPGSELVADAVQGSALGAPFFPSGLSDPPQCRFRRLGDALAAAAAGDTVKMAGWTAGEVKFSSAATGESFPLTVNQGVTLTTADASPAPAHYVIEVDQGGQTRPVLQVGNDAAVSGFTIRPAAGGSASDALWVNCSVAGSSLVALSSLVLDGKGSLAASTIDEGLKLDGPCDVAATSLVVENAAKTGIRVLSATSSASVTIASSTIRGNGDGGLVVNVDASLGAPSVSLLDNQVAGNRATTVYTVGAVSRRAGGVVLQSATPSPFVFSGNQVHGNSFDQVLVYSSNAWNLSAATCGAASNTFACYDTTSAGGPWVGLAAIGGGAVNAANAYWANGVPSSGTDYFQASGSTVTSSPSCGMSSLTCP